ncbi:MAG: hypothetical protein AAGL34_19025 [Bacteroidota bacterium]
MLNVLKEISFLSRYKEICSQHRPTIKMKKYDNAKVAEIIQSFGYPVRYYRSENFFAIKQKVEAFDFTFNLKFKSGICEFIWYFHFNDEWIEWTGTWLGMAWKIMGEETPVPPPCFESYAELQAILEDVFDIYEDCKIALIKET